MATANSQNTATWQTANSQNTATWQTANSQNSYMANCQ